MSLLPGDTFVNATRSLYAAAGSGGGGGGNTLTSPASVTPDVNGATALSLTAQGVGNATLSVSSPGEATVAVNGSQSLIAIGEAAGIPLSLLNAGDGILRIQSGTSQSLPNTASFDCAGNVINLGNPGAAGNVFVNSKLIYTAAGGAPGAAFPAIVLGSTAGAFVQGDNTIALGGLAAGLYAMYGDTGASTIQTDLDCRFNSIVQINPAQTCSGGAGGADTGWNLSPNGTGGLTLNLTNAPTAAFSVKCYPLYLF